MNAATVASRCAMVVAATVLWSLTACEGPKGAATPGGAEPETPKQIYNAIDALDAQLEKDPNDGDAYVKRGNYKLAVADFEKGETVAVLYEEAWADFKAAHELAGGTWDFPDVVRETMRAVQEKDYRPDFRPLLHKDKAGSVAALRGAARVAGRLYNHGMSVMLLRRAAALAPDDPWVQAGLVAAEGYVSGDTRSAARKVEAMGSNPALQNDADYWQTLGTLRLLGDDAAGAETALRRCLSIDPARMPAKTNLLSALLQQGKQEEAAKLNAAIGRVNENAIFAENNYAAEFLRKRQYAEALPLFRAITKKYPGFPMGWLNLGRCLLGLRQYDEALRAAKMAVELVPNAPDGHVLLQYVYGSRGLQELLAGNAAAAVEDFAQANTHGPRNPLVVLQRWIALQEVGRGAEADASVQAALPDMHDAPNERLVRMLAGKLTPEEVLAKVPNRERECEACFFIGELHRAQGDAAAACTWYRKTVAFGITTFIEHKIAERRLQDCPPE